ncbi:DJ-1/PfpI family protein [Psychrobacillus sp. NEAU-3TGS]|uniref:DJ-1/PfpI family protein n=1 Tax=Psychrobacillus sp. NEAU-3TGS TaxID=2995412 RepID=UPI002497AB58|nr:DJ-1/PfpI family protein [Psychrobacillus sp. NEAU-3TGS]
MSNGFNGQEVTSVLNFLQQNGVFMEIVSERLGIVTGDDGTQIQVNKTFLTSSPYLVDSVYVVGGNVENKPKLKQDIKYFVNTAYKNFKPIGVASTGQTYIKASDKNNLVGVVSSINNPNFSNEFVSAIAQQRFWDRT